MTFLEVRIADIAALMQALGQRLRRYTVEHSVEEIVKQTVF